MKPISIHPLEKEIRIRFSGNKVKLPEMLNQEIEKHWQGLISNNPKLFNGEVFTVTNVSETDKTINVDIDETNYAYYLYDIRRNGPGPSGIRLIHSSVIPITSDSKILIGSMNDHTKLPGNVQFCGGGLDFDDIKDNEVDIDHNTKKELGEELGINSSNTQVVESLKKSFIKFGGYTDTIVVYYILRLNITAEDFQNRYDKFVEYLKTKEELPEFKKIFVIDFKTQELEKFVVQHADHLEEAVPDIFRMISVE